MAEYIEREALEIALNHRLNFLMAENGEYDHYTSGYDEAVDTVENFPSADVVPRWPAAWECKYKDDCIRHIEFIGRNYVLDAKNTYEYHPLSFCSYGERKDGDAD